MCRKARKVVLERNMGPNESKERGRKQMRKS